jgi:spermidine/putrescine-binding protein
MKKIISTCILGISLLTSCGNNEQTKALEDGKKMAAALKEMRPGGIATSPAGWTMTAKFNGKPWSANSMISPEVAGRIFGENNGESISLPYDRRGMIAGKKMKFSQNNAVDLMTNDEVALWGGYSGEMEITKVDDEWAEGRFSVTGSTDTPDKLMVVTEGFFRVSLTKKQ